MEALKKYIPLNWELLANPINWVIIFLMIAIFSLGIAYLHNSTPDEEE